MTARLLGTPGSHPVLGAELMLRHRGVPYRRLKVGGPAPLLQIDGERVRGAKAIARRLGFLASPEEDWADEVLGDWVRVLARRRRARLPTPDRGRSEEIRERFEASGRHLDRIDAWLARGVLGREQPTAADFRVAACLRLALGSDDLRPLIEGRPAAQLAVRLAPDQPAWSSAQARSSPR